MSSVRAQAAATSPLPISAATASGPQPSRQASSVPRPVLWPTTPARMAHTREGSSDRQATLVGLATTRAGSGRPASRRQVRYSMAAPSPTRPEAALYAASRSSSSENQGIVERARAAIKERKQQGVGQRMMERWARCKCADSAFEQREAW
jgi:hypothetical protein